MPPGCVDHNRGVRSVLLAIAILALGAACSGGDERGAPRDFCESVAAFDEDVATATVEEQQELLEQVVDTAPPEIRPEAETFLEGYERLEAGEDVIPDEDRYRDAAEEVQRFAIEECGLLDQRQPGGI